MPVFNSRESGFKGIEMGRMDLVAQNQQFLNFKKLKINTLNLLEMHGKKTLIDSNDLNWKFNFSQFPLNKIDVFSEWNITPTWNDITTALKSTPSNKAAGIDGIPSKFRKLVQDETKPNKICGKLLQVIKGFYRLSKLAVKVNDAL
ncbi:hypothetical protein BB561_002720 [Smittium simulii]|uniref:Uncharacterized protein n=1 Tax=Smittium simulii TaxID=133385 RepID=A0A2T9YPD8_9FUNG|nr:hypothetical protein BB561_002720 [Smittium simulii]